MSGYVHEKITLAVDFLLFTIEEERLKLLMVRRKEEPFKDMLALPGVAVREQETLSHAARRCLKEETGIKEEVYLEQYIRGEMTVRETQEVEWFQYPTWH